MCNGRRIWELSTDPGLCNFTIKMETMRTENLLPILNIKSFYDFVKSNINEQVKLLKKEGVFLDHDSEQETITCLYFLQGFFAEVIFSKTTKDLIEIVPFKQGYKIS